MALFGGREEVTKEALMAHRDEDYKFIKVGRNRRIPISRIKEYEEQSARRVKVTLLPDSEGKEEVLILGVDIDVFDAVVNLSMVSMNNET